MYTVQYFVALVTGSACVAKSSVIMSDTSVFAAFLVAESKNKKIIVIDLSFVSSLLV